MKGGALRNYIYTKSRLLCAEQSMHLHPAETLSSFTSVNMKAVVFLCLLVVSYVCATEPYQWDKNGTTSKNPPPAACSSNYASCGCCLMEQEIEWMMEYFNHAHEVLSTYLTKAKNAVNQIRATTSVFSVTLASQNYCFGPFSTNQNIPYGTVIINKGNNYDTSTGVYTAPFSGIYSLAVTIYSNFTGQTQNKACAILSVNGNTVAQLTEKPNGDHQDSSSVVITKNLTAGDTVSVIQPSGCAFCGNNHNHNTFTGFFLYH